VEMSMEKVKKASYEDMVACYQFVQRIWSGQQPGASITTGTAIEYMVTIIDRTKPGSSLRRQAERLLDQIIHHQRDPQPGNPCKKERPKHRSACDTH
jgi:hypothetical protein